MMTALLYLLVFLILATAAYGAWSAAPYLPTRKRDVSRMINLAEIKKEDKVYDLGCGDGRLVFAAADRGADAIGIEIFVLPYLYAWFKNLFRSKKAKILFGDLFKYNISDASAVFIFLLDNSYGRLAGKFSRELKPGAKVIVGCWEISEWKDKLVNKDQPTEKDLPIYLYQM